MHIYDEYIATLDGARRLLVYDFLRASGALRDHSTQAWVAKESIPDDVIYRVEISPTTKRVRVLILGMTSVDEIDGGDYNSADDLPQWMQEKLAVLSMMSPKPPTEFVEGVGRRIEMYVYWLVRH